MWAWKENKVSSFTNNYWRFRQFR